MPYRVKGWKVAAWGAVLGVLVFVVAMLWTAPDQRHPCVEIIAQGQQVCP